MSDTLQYYKLYHNTMTLLWLYYGNLQVCKPTVYLQVTTGHYSHYRLHGKAPLFADEKKWIRTYLVLHWVKNVADKISTTAQALKHSSCYDWFHVYVSWVVYFYLKSSDLFHSLDTCFIYLCSYKFHCLSFTFIYRMFYLPCFTNDWGAAVHASLYISS